MNSQIEQLRSKMAICDNDRKIARYEQSKGTVLHRITRRLTKWAWRGMMRATINRMHERGLIDSFTLHEAYAFSDELLK